MRHLRFSGGIDPPTAESLLGYAAWRGGIAGHRPFMLTGLWVVCKNLEVHGGALQRIQRIKNGLVSAEDAHRDLQLRREIEKDNHGWVVRPLLAGVVLIALLFGLSATQGHGSDVTAHTNSAPVVLNGLPVATEEGPA